MFLDFDFGLSSGETAFIDLWSKLYQIQKSIKQDLTNNINISNIILIFDEADMLLHPQWQKEYIEKIIQIISELFHNCDGVQILLSSHSPIMLSDIPKQNIIYLEHDANTGISRAKKRSSRHETFASNIFKLFQDTFFLDNTGIGSFAEGKMAKMLERIHKINNKSDDNEINNIKRFINVIGDPYLKRHFELEFYKYYGMIGDDKFKADWKRYLERELSLLNQKENQNDKNQ